MYGLSVATAVPRPAAQDTASARPTGSLSLSLAGQRPSPALGSQLPVGPQDET